MKTIFYLTLLLISSIGFAQKPDTGDNVGCGKPLAFTPEDKFNADLKATNLTLYLLGGIVSVLTKADVEFEKHYKINYHDFGCTPPSNFEFYEKYNQLVFDYLVKQYGKNWIKETNPNAFGFKKWNKK